MQIIIFIYNITSIAYNQIYVIIILNNFYNNIQKTIIIKKLKYKIIEI